MFEVMDQVIVSEYRDMLGLLLWRRTAPVFVACDTIASGQADAVRGITGCGVSVDLNGVTKVELKLEACH